MQVSASKPKIEKLNFLTSLESFVIQEFVLAKNNRQSSGVNTKLISSQNQYNAIYEASIAQQIADMGGTDIYRRLTAQKCESLVSWLNDILMPTMGDNFWSISPTPIPDLPEDVSADVIRKAAITGMKIYYNSPVKNNEVLQQAQQATIQEVDRLQKELLAKLREEAQSRADKMQLNMEDQLVDGDWEKTVATFFLYYTIYPTAFLKGPIVTIQKTLKYDRDGNPIVKDIPVLTWKAVSPFDMYPSADATNVNQGKIFEYFKISRAELMSLKDLPNYNNVVIDDILRIEYTPKNTEEDQYIKQDRRILENINNTNISDSNVFEGVEMWGQISGYLLKGWGVPNIEDEKASYEAHIIMVADKIIKATLNEDLLGRRPYYQCSYKPIPNSFWGISLPESMSDIQRLCNATVRALADNMAIASGPMVAYDLAQLPPEEDITSLYPWKIFMFDGMKSMNTRKPIEFFQPTNNSAQLLPLYEQIKAEADNVTNIPSFSMGNTDVKGAGQTASGLSILQGNLTKGIKDHVLNISLNVLIPALKRLFDWNMLYNPDKAIKGDCSVVVNGPLKVVTKEQKQVRMNEILQLTNNPVDMQIIGLNGRKGLLEEIFRINDIPSKDIIPEEVAQPMQPMQQEQAIPQQTPNNNLQ